MKTKQIQTLLFLGLISFNSLWTGAVFANEGVVREQVMSEQETLDLTPLQDGLDVSITPRAMQEMQRWARSAKSMLENLLSEVQVLRRSQQVQHLESGIERIVLSTGSRRAQLLMRYSLNRALYVGRLIDREASEAVRGVTDFKINLYRHAIELAIRYYESDLAYLNGEEGSVRQPYAEFGVAFANKLLQLNRGMIDASAQYHILFATLTFLRSDLNADANGQEYAEDFMRLTTALEAGVAGSADDQVLIVRLRALKRVMDNLDISNGQGLLQDLYSVRLQREGAEDYRRALPEVAQAFLREREELRAQVEVRCEGRWLRRFVNHESTTISEYRNSEECLSTLSERDDNKGLVCVKAREATSVSYYAVYDYLRGLRVGRSNQSSLSGCTRYLRFSSHNPFAILSRDDVDPSNPHTQLFSLITNNYIGTPGNDNSRRRTTAYSSYFGHAWLWNSIDQDSIEHLQRAFVGIYGCEATPSGHQGIYNLVTGELLEDNLGDLVDLSVCIESLETNSRYRIVE